MKNIGEKSFKNIGARNIQRNKKSVGWVGTGAGFHTDVAAVVHNTVNTANTEFQRKEAHPAPLPLL